MNCDQHVKHKVTIEHVEDSITTTDVSTEATMPKLLHMDGLMKIPESQRSKHLMYGDLTQEHHTLYVLLISLVFTSFH
ncbi:hypothetical protein EON65_06380 [archaeon]|nr:MAG: hypothetical protein EON65_06380 [archaeon]